MNSSARRRLAIAAGAAVVAVGATLVFVGHPVPSPAPAARNDDVAAAPAAAAVFVRSAGGFSASAISVTAPARSSAPAIVATAGVSAAETFPEFLTSLERMAPGNPSLAVKAVTAKLRELGSDEAAKKIALLTALYRLGANPAVAALARAEMAPSAASDSIVDAEERTRYRIRASQLYFQAADAAEAVRGTIGAVRELPADSSLRSYYVGALLMKYPAEREAVLAEGERQDVDLAEAMSAAAPLIAAEVPAAVRNGAKLATRRVAAR